MSRSAGGGAAHRVQLPRASRRQDRNVEAARVGPPLSPVWQVVCDEREYHWLMANIELDDRGVIVACAACGRKNRLHYERLDAASRCANCKQPLAPPAAP